LAFGAPTQRNKSERYVFDRFFLNSPEKDCAEQFGFIAESETSPLSTILPQRNPMMSWRVYLLRCSDNSLYCGTTTDIERRLAEHNQGVGSRYTRSRLPVRLVWSSGELTKSESFKEEYRIKRLSKVMKEGIIDIGGNEIKSPGERQQG
jgi:putative endonuclease